MNEAVLALASPETVRTQQPRRRIDPVLGSHGVHCRSLQNFPADATRVLARHFLVENAHSLKMVPNAV